MTANRRKEAKSIFKQALDLPKEERTTFLKAACGGDGDLEAEVRSLLAADREASGFLESDPLAGSLIGEYQVLGLIARGGMGAVYRARQDNPRREVALKLIDRHFASPDLLRRFQVEAQVLARLQHPGIAQIHTAGTTTTDFGDRPFFAMELIDGLPLTRYADQRKLNRRERLDLMIRICEAVQHAHQVGVIHRDLKPANILVTNDGQPKVLDFGVARSTDADLQVTTLAGSQPALIGTLPYMSPEQVRGNPDELDTRSDVYALGILCFELLTGHLPRETEGKTLTDAIRIIVDNEPRSLAAATGDRFPVDLEAIVGKALEQDKDRRYESAAAFAADLRRYLDGHPVAAKPQSAVYQLRKLVARNRLAAGLLAALLLLSVGSAVLLAIQSGRTALERDRANIEASTAGEVSLFLQSLFLDVDPERALGEDLTARDILDRGRERIETELPGQPAVRTRLLIMLGKVYDSLGHRDQAWPLLEEAVTTGRSLLEVDPASARNSNIDLGLVLLGGLYAGDGRNAEAIALCREAVAIAGSAHGAESRQYATALNHLAYQLSLVGEFDEARGMLEQALELRTMILGPDDVDTGWSLYQYAWLLRMTGDPEAARDKFEAACSNWENAFPKGHPQIARCLHDYSHVLRELGDHEASVKNVERALEIRLNTLGPTHPLVADTVNDVGNSYWYLGDREKSLRRYRESTEMYRRNLGEDNPVFLTKLDNLADIHEQMGQPEEAEAVLQEIVSLARQHHDGRPELLGDALGRLGTVYLRQRQDDLAAPALEEASRLLQASDQDLFGKLMAYVESTAKERRANGDEPGAAALLRLWSDLNSDSMGDGADPG